MQQSTPIRSSTNPTNGGDGNNGLNLELDDIDLESLRLVFGSASPEDLSKRKAHELRELWLEKTNQTVDSSTTTTSTATTSSSRKKIPRFLLDPKNKDHVAPHAVALQLLLGRKGIRDPSGGDGLYKRVPRSETEGRIGQENSNQQSSHQDMPSRSNQHNNIDDHHEIGATGSFGTTLHATAVLVAIIALTCQFVLEVLGGAGAIWGCAELVRLRKGGTGDPSWDICTWVALGVGICCLVRFLLVHPFFTRSTDPSFAEKYKLHDLLLVHRHRNNGFGLMLELAKLVASDPVLFLHPTKGQALPWCCGCYCVCNGNRQLSFDPNSGETDVNNNTTGNVRQSPGSLGKASPQRSTWDLSDDDDDDNHDDEYGFDATTGP